MIITLKSQQSKHSLSKKTSCPTLREYMSSPGFSTSLEKRKLSHLPTFFHVIYRQKKYEIISKALGEEPKPNIIKQQSKQKVKECKFHSRLF